MTYFIYWSLPYTVVKNDPNPTHLCLEDAQMYMLRKGLEDYLSIPGRKAEVHTKVDQYTYPWVFAWTFGCYLSRYEFWRHITIVVK